jgi:hypothetical protein
VGNPVPTRLARVEPVPHELTRPLQEVEYRARVPSRLLLLLALAAAVSLGLAAPADASRYARYGIQDDAWLASGAGTLESRLDTLERLGVELVRFTVHWDRVAPRMPARPRVHGDPAYDWSVTDAVLGGLRERGIPVVLTIYGAPGWANGGRARQWAPTRPVDMGDFAFAAATRYPHVRDWLVWNEPNQRRWLQPTTPAVYTTRILNPAYAQIKRAIPAARVGGGVTAPRGNVGGVSPVAWIRGMRTAGARLDAYAHHPYPERPKLETPWSGGCSHCATITMATLERLISEVQRAFPRKRIWLTEYGYQSMPEERILGVTKALQARYLAEAAHRVYEAPYVDMLIRYMVRDDTEPGGWQSGLFNRSGTAKPAAAAFPFPVAQVERSGGSTTLWGHVRPGKGTKTYRLRVQRPGGAWTWAGAARRTDGRGFWRATVAAPAGSKVQLYSPRDDRYGAVVTVR